MMTLNRPATRAYALSYHLCLRGQSTGAKLPRGKVDTLGARQLRPLQFKYLQCFGPLKSERPMCLVSSVPNYGDQVSVTHTHQKLDSHLPFERVHSRDVYFLNNWSGGELLIIGWLLMIRNNLQCGWPFSRLLIAASYILILLMMNKHTHTTTTTTGSSSSSITIPSIGNLFRCESSEITLLQTTRAIVA